jgi:bromodomain adjacent to zinc finger domain protein 1A
MNDSYRQPLHLSTFTLDEFEHALRHAHPDPPCALLAEIHSTLIYNLRTVTFQRHSALVSLLRLKAEAEEADCSDEKFGVSIEELTAAMADVGNNWERVPLRHTEGREGWEDALMGCLKDVGHLTSIEKPCSINIYYHQACYFNQLSSSPGSSHSLAICT